MKRSKGLWGPLLLCDKPSAFNGRVMVTDEDGVRTLYFNTVGGDKQAVYDSREPTRLHLPYVQVMAEVISAVTPCKRVLMLGLGAGTIPTLVAREWADVAQVEVVELDPVVEEVAREHLGVPQLPNLRVTIGDGRAAVEARAAASVDLFVLDAYGPVGQPRALATVEFCRQVQRVIEPARGLVLANVFGSESNTHYRSMLATWEHVFDIVEVVRVPNSSNKILVAQTSLLTPAPRALASPFAPLLKD
jgi:spermidine synthase